MVSGFYLVSEESDKANEIEVFKKLNPNVDIKLVNFEDIIPIAGDINQIMTVNGLIDFPDFVFVRAFDLSADKQYHVKSVLRMLEYKGVLCINTADTKDKTSDKLLTNQIVSSVAESVKVPKTMLITPKTDGKFIADSVGLPAVIKVMHGSGGKGLSLIKTVEELDELLNIIFAAPFDEQLIEKEAIMSSKGRDIRLVVANGEVIDSFIRENPDDFKSNVSAGGSIIPYDTPEILVKDTLKIANKLNLKVGSIDFLFGENENEFYFCEANSTIGLPYLLNAPDEKNKELLKKYSGLLMKTL